MSTTHVLIGIAIYYVIVALVLTFRDAIFGRRR